MLPPPDISTQYVDEKTGRPSKDFFNWIKSLQAARSSGSPYVYIGDFNPAGDGTSNDTGALLAAFDALPRGGVVLLGTQQYLFDDDVEVPEGVIIVGQNYKPQEVDGVFGNTLGETSTVIWLNSTKTYTWATQSGLMNCSVLKSGMVAPTTTAEATALVASFSGTAITITGDDVIMDTLFIGGFDRALAWDDVNNFWARPRFKNIFFDCINGFVIGGIPEAGAFEGIKGFPVLTGHDELFPGFPAPADGDRVLHRRPGTGLAFFNDQGWGSAYNCNMFGWEVSWKFTDIGNMVLVDCSADTDAYGVLPMSCVGYWVLGRSQITLLGPTAAGQAQAFKIETDDAEAFVNCIGGYFFTNATHVKIESTGGDVSFSHAKFFDVANAHGDETEPIWQVTAAGKTKFTDNAFFDPNSTYPGAIAFKVDAGTVTQFSNEFTNCTAGIEISPTPHPSYTVGTVPAAASWSGSVIYVSNEIGGPVLAFSDGANWRRVTDLVIIS